MTSKLASITEWIKKCNLHQLKLVACLQRPTLASVQAAVRAFMQDREVVEGFLPTIRQLKDANQRKLVQDIQHLGGMNKLAASMQLQYSAARYPTLASAAEALKLWAQQYPNTRPSRQTLQTTGHYDLAIAYNKFGWSAVRSAAGLPRMKNSLVSCSATWHTL